MAKYCRYCGNPVREGANFCKTCGRELTKKTAGPGSGPSQAAPSPVVPAPQKAARKKNNAWIFAAAVLILAAIAGAAFFYPGFLRADPLQRELPVLSDEEVHSRDTGVSGVSSLFFNTETARPETASVSAAQPQVRFKNDVAVSFDEYCLSDEARQLSVASLGTQNDGVYEAAAYDFLLDGKDAEFDGLAGITLPYDPAWGTNVFVQYYDKRAGAWQILFAEPDGNGHVTFHTNHFCTFAVFYEMVETGKGAGNAGKEILTFSDPYRDGLRLRATVHWDVLAAKLRDGRLAADAKLGNLSKQNNTFFADRALTYLGGAAGGADYIAKAAKIPGVSRVLGPIGQSLTVAKFYHQGFNEGWNKAIKDNGADLAMMAVASASAIPGPVGWACAAASLTYYVYSTAEAVKTDWSLEGWNSSAEYAYRKFNESYLEYNRNSGTVGIRFRILRPGGFDNRKNVLPMSYGDSKEAKAVWKAVIEDAMMRDKRGEMKAADYVERIVDSYANYFWKMSSGSRDRFLEQNNAKGWLTWLTGEMSNTPLKDVYKTPSPKARRQYIATMRSELYKAIKPSMDQILKNEYYEMMNSAYDHFLKLEQELNVLYTIELIDPNVEYFTSSKFATHPIGLSTSADGPVAAVNKWSIGKTARISFTGAGWAEMGCPSWLRILGKQGDTWNFDHNFLTRELKLQPGLNTVVISDADPTPEPTQPPTPTPRASINKFAGYWKEQGGQGMTVTIGYTKDGGLAYGEMNKKKESIGYKVDDWTVGTGGGTSFTEANEPKLTMYSKGFVGGYVECGMAGDDYMVIRNGNGERQTYSRTSSGYDVSGVTEYSAGNLPSGRTMGVGTTVNSLTLGGRSTASP